MSLNGVIHAPVTVAQRCSRTFTSRDNVPMCRSARYSAFTARKSPLHIPPSPRASLVARATSVAQPFSEGAPSLAALKSKVCTSVLVLVTKADSSHVDLDG